MTPTEQDKELREKLYSIFEIDCDYYSPTVQNGCGYDGFYCRLHATMLDNAMQLIATDRKRVELEARIHEIGLMQHQARVNLKTSNAVVEWGDIRIAELKAQQEENNE